MPRQLIVANALGADLGKSRIERHQELALELTVNLAAIVNVLHVAADVRIKENRVFQPIAVLPEAADGNRGVKANGLIDDAEGNGLRRPVLVAQNFLRIEIVNALILRRVAAVSEALPDALKDLADAGAKVALKDRRLRRSVIGVFPRLGTDLHHFPLLHDDHALAVGHGDTGSVGDDVLFAAGIGAAPLRAGALLPLRHQNVHIEGVAVEELFPLIG